MSYYDKYNNIKFDFMFLDELYKIDNEFTVEEETQKENERDLAFRVALELGCKTSKDILLAGPFLTFQETRNNCKLY